MRIKGRRWIKLTAILAVIAVVLSVLMISLTAPDSHSVPFDPYPAVGYALSSTIVSEKFNNRSTSFDLSVKGRSSTHYDFSEQGLRVTFDDNTSKLQVMKYGTRSNVIRALVDVGSLDNNHSFFLSANFKVKEKPSFYYGALIGLSTNTIELIPNAWLGQGTPLLQRMTYTYDVKARENVDITIQALNGNVVVGVDGVSTEFKVEKGAYSDLQFEGFSLFPNEYRWSSPSTVTLRCLELGDGGDVMYHDRLHKTITPWGHDFTLALQIHTDGANPAQLALLKLLADRYGVRGEFAAWMNVSDTATAYSITTNDDYAAALLALQRSGWDISLHAAKSGSADRAEVIDLIERFEERYGPLRSWVDHGPVSQDIWQQGNDPSSNYYISDYLLSKNVMIWVNEEDHSHSQVQDLNLDAVSYHHDRYPGLSLLKVSRFGFLADCTGWLSYFAPADRTELSDRQRIYASNSAVMIWHDYTNKYTYVEDAGVNYSTQSLPDMGYRYELLTGTVNPYTHPNGTWHLIPAVEDYFAAMKSDYNVWYATPREVYDRSIQLEQVHVDENETRVTITNPTAVDVPGFTLFTKEKPWYCLLNGDQRLCSQRGAENFCFVIPDLPAGATLVLDKANNGSSDASNGPSSLALLLGQYPAYPATGNGWLMMPGAGRASVGGGA